MGITEGPFQNITSLFKAGGFQAILVPENFIDATQVTCDGAFTVNWSDGEGPISYLADATPSEVPGGNITVTSSSLTFFRCITNTITSCAITGAELLTDMTISFLNLSKMTSFSIDDTSNVETFPSAWRGCSGLTSFPSIDIGSATGISNTWQNCTGLTSFPLIDFSSYNGGLPLAWRNCAGLTSFPLIDTSGVVSFLDTFRSCSGLTSFPSLDYSSSIDFQGTFRSCSGLTSLPALNTEAGIAFNYMFQNCSSLQTIGAINTLGSGGGLSMFAGCTALTSPSPIRSGDPLPPPPYDSVQDKIDGSDFGGGYDFN